MKNYLDIIESKLRKNIKLESITIIDNSNKHRHHKFFDSKKFHLHIKIKSSYLKTLPRINAQRIIMNVLNEDLKNKIHALEISIEQ
tara:strand:+ start:195 stop:452 length:258 start_codon:yes stop_codon:yes gene_type:complete